MTRNFIVEAKRRGIEVISEIELGYRYSKADFVCITGTNGKTTCTALTGEMFKAAGKTTYVLGNIGIAISAHALETKPGDVVVAETAALQLEGNSRFHAIAAGVCNITPDHLDHFGTMENYIAAKAKILDNQTEKDYAVLNYDDPTVRGFAKLTPAHVLYFSRKSEVEQGMFLRGNKLVYRIGDTEKELMNAEDIRIPGAHNLENAMLCALLALSQGIDPETIVSVMKTFAGVEHRIEYVCTRGGVDYINDSKGTNPASTVRAIEAMKKPTVLILGGYDKHISFDELFEAFTPIVKACVVIGDTQKQILETAEKYGYARAGIILYGLNPSEEVKDPAIRPVMELKSVVSMVKSVPPGTSISYGRKFIAENEMRIATVPVGYADGFSRSLSGHAEFLIRGKRARVVGTVCMDQLMLDVSHIQDVQMGDEVTIFGRDGEEEISAAELASRASTINYEIVCAVGHRVPRVYYRNGAVVTVVNYLHGGQEGEDR